MNKLASIINKATNGEVLIPLLDKFVGGHEKNRGFSHLHASDISQPAFCPREVSLVKELNLPPGTSYIAQALRATFDAGNDQQARVNNDWLVSVMFGNWKCTSCGKVDNLRYKPETKKCGDTICRYRYREPLLHCADVGVHGSIDGLVNVGTGALRLMEAKIIAADAFKPLAAPLAEHALRSRIYLYLLANTQWLKHTGIPKIDTKRASILYISRGHGAKNSAGKISPFREFIVTRDDNAIRKELSKAKAYTMYQTQMGVGYPCRVCTTPMDKRAQSCPVVSACFSSNFVDSITWVNENNEPQHSHASYVAELENVPYAPQD